MSVLFRRAPLLPRASPICGRRSIFAGQLRRFSPIAIYSSFPTTLYHFNQGPKSRLFDYDTASQEDRETKYGNDGVKVADDGLVYPAIYQEMPLANGALFMPNTFYMQEHIRMFYDYYLEDVQSGKTVEMPLLFRIPKGTLLPNGLVLLHEHTATFSLQPSRGMPLQSLNRILDEFYSKHAEQHGMEQWLSQHDYSAALDETKPETWITA